MRDQSEPAWIDVPAEVQKLRDEKAKLIRRLVVIDQQINAYGYLHTNNFPVGEIPRSSLAESDLVADLVADLAARADREEPTP